MNGVYTPNYLEGVCREKCLLKSDTYYLCARGGKFKGEKNLVKVPYIFREGKKPLSIFEVREICKDCYNYNKGLTDDEFDKIIEKNSKVFCFQKRLIKTDYGYMCLRGGPTNDALLNFVSIDKPYIFKIDGDAMSLDLCIRICNSACIYSGLYVL